MEAEPSGVKQAPLIAVTKENKMKVRRLAFWMLEPIVFCCLAVKDERLEES